MQNYTNILPTQTLTESRDPLLNNDQTAISCNSGDAFPTAYYQVGMLCYRTDLSQLYQLRQLPATISSNWVLVADLTEDYTYKAYVDANFALKGGDYSGLRARSTTKADVGLSNLPNAITDSLSNNTNDVLATAKASYSLNQLIEGLNTRLTAAETELPLKAHVNGSTANYFRADTFYAATSIQCNGDIIAAAGVTIPSDRRLKKDIAPIDDALERLESITGVTYTLRANDRECIGLIAQEVEETIPEVVRHHNGHLALDYASMAGVFVNAINELSERLKKLEAANAAL